MQTIERIPQVPVNVRRNWQNYLLGTFLAIAGSLLLTGIIYSAGLYPRIPDIAIIYLLVIVPLAIAQGTYSAIVAAVVASLSFDYFLVPPLYTFTIGRWEEWISLAVFLLTALLVSLLAAQVRRNGEEARIREREARILYELMRVTNDATSLDDQLDVVTLSVVRVFSAWSVNECGLFLPDANGQLIMRADAPVRVERFSLTAAELQGAQEVMKSGHMLERGTAVEQGPMLRMLPLKSQQRTFGVLCLRIHNRAAWHANVDRISNAPESSDVNFFWTFMSQATALVERGLLRAQVTAHGE